MGHSGHRMNMYGVIMVIMGNLHAGGHILETTCHELNTSNLDQCR